jgi:hypothetical protein
MKYELVADDMPARAACVMYKLVCMREYYY